MIRLLLIILVLVASVFLGLKIAADPGYVIFAYQNWTVEMPLWFAAISTLVGLFLLYFILRFFDGIETTWLGFKSWLRLRKKYKSYSKTNRGLLALIEAQWKLAESNVMSGVEQSDAPLINFLAAAKAAHEQGAFEKRDTYIRKAYDVAPQSNMAIGLTQAQLQIEQGKYEQALATLNHLRTLAPKQVLVLKLLKRVYLHLGEWSNLLTLLPVLVKTKILTTEASVQLEIKAYQEILKTAQKKGGLSQLKACWNAIPAKVKKSADLLYVYTTLLLDYPDTAVEAEELIVKALKYSLHVGLVMQYGKLITANPTKQLKIAESWQKHYGANAILFLTLGRLSMRCQIWGKARQHLEDSLRLEPLAQTYFELGNLLFQLGETDEAVELYKAGILQKDSACSH